MIKYFYQLYKLLSTSLFLSTSPFSINFIFLSTFQNSIKLFFDQVLMVWLVLWQSMFRWVSLLFLHSVYFLESHTLQLKNGWYVCLVLTVLNSVRVCHTKISNDAFSNMPVAFEVTPTQLFGKIKIRCQKVTTIE